MRRPMGPQTGTGPDDAVAPMAAGIGGPKRNVEFCPIWIMSEFKKRGIVKIKFLSISFQGGVSVKKRQRVFLIALALIVAAALLAGCGKQAPKEQATTQEKAQQQQEQSGKPIVLKYAFFAPANTFPAKQMEKWAEEVEKRTNGKVQVETFPGGTLLTARNMYDGVLQGVADIGLSCPSYEPGRFPLLAIADVMVPYQSGKLASVVFYDLIQEFQPKELADFKVITAFTTNGGRLMSRKPVAKLGDFKGLRIRISGTGVPAVEALGGSAVGMPQSEVPQALQTGVIDGLVSSTEVMRDLRYAEYTKYVTNYQISLTSFVAAMNKKVWESLPPDVQKVIDDLGREMALWTGEYLDNYDREVMDWAAKEQGVKVIELSPEERAKWDEKVKAVQEKYIKDAEAKGLPARQFAERLLQLKETYSKELEK